MTSYIYQTITYFSKYCLNSSFRKPMSQDKGKQPINPNKPCAIQEPFLPLHIPFPFSKPLPSAKSQVFLDKIWSTHLSGQRNSRMRKNISDLAIHLKSLESRIQFLEQQWASSSIPRIEKQFRTQLLEKVNGLLP